MNEWDKLHRMAERYKAEYRSGTRIMLKVKQSLTFEYLGEDMHRVDDNTRSTVLTVDDIGTLPICISGLSRQRTSVMISTTSSLTSFPYSSLRTSYSICPRTSFTIPSTPLSSQSPEGW